MNGLVPGETIASVLVTVKTYPSPSDRHGETVCVAGVRLDRGAPEWIRLFPIKFRLVDYDQQFKKYEIIEVPIRPHDGRDTRPESMRPDQSRLCSSRLVGTSHEWAERRRLLGALVGATTTCELIAANQAVNYSQPAPSLGLVRVNDIVISVADGEPWNANQLDKAAKAAAPDLFNQDGLRQLDPAPFQVKVKYRCDSGGCRGHNAKLIDWETGQAGRKWSRLNGAVRAKEMLQEKYEGLFGADRDAHLYVGNMNLYHTTFSGLGVWSPKKVPADPYDGTLLDY